MWPALGLRTAWKPRPVLSMTPRGGVIDMLETLGEPFELISRVLPFLPLHVCSRRRDTLRGGASRNSHITSLFSRAPVRAYLLSYTAGVPSMRDTLGRVCSWLLYMCRQPISSSDNLVSKTGDFLDGSSDSGVDFESIVVHPSAPNSELTSEQSASLDEEDIRERESSASPTTAQDLLEGILHRSPVVRTIHEVPQADYSFNSSAEDPNRHAQRRLALLQELGIVLPPEDEEGSSSRSTTLASEEVPPPPEVSSFSSGSRISALSLLTRRRSSRHAAPPSPATSGADSFASSRFLFHAHRYPTDGDVGLTRVTSANGASTTSVWSPERFVLGSLGRSMLSSVERSPSDNYAQPGMLPNAPALGPISLPADTISTLAAPSPRFPNPHSTLLERYRPSSEDDESDESHDDHQPYVPVPLCAPDSPAPFAPPGLGPPRRHPLRQYHVLGRLGSGAMADVLQARDSTSRLVAIKCIQKDMVVEQARTAATVRLNESRCANVLNEIGTMRRAPDLSPFLVSTMHTFQDDDRVYIVMPSFSCCLADVLVQRRPLSLYTVRVWAAEMILGMEALHGEGLIHCDLKPANVLLMPSGHACIADFGLVARGSDIVGGTPEYMAPEQLARWYKSWQRDFPFYTHLKDEITPLIDVWAFGLIVLELLRGKMVFDPRHPRSNVLGEWKYLRELLSTAARSAPGRIPRDTIWYMLQEILLSPLYERPSWPQIKQFEFFRGLSWGLVENQIMTPDFKPHPPPLMPYVLPSPSGRPDIAPQLTDAAVNFERPIGERHDIMHDALPELGPRRELWTHPVRSSNPNYS